MTISVKKASISSKPTTVYLSCPPLCGLFSIQQNANGGLSYKAKKDPGQHIRSCAFQDLFLIHQIIQIIPHKYSGPDQAFFSFNRSRISANNSSVVGPAGAAGFSSSLWSFEVTMATAFTIKNIHAPMIRKSTMFWIKLP